MFNFIKKEMTIDAREMLNFTLGCGFIIIILLTITAYVGPFKPLVVIPVLLLILVGYMFYLNNSIGLEQERKEKELKK